MARPEWDEYFMQLARAASTRATCERRHVGCVIVRDRRVISTGYNASIRGMEHCDSAGHMIVNGECIRALHAEENAIVNSAKHGVSIEQSVLYTTHFPCWNCFRKIANAGIVQIIYDEFKFGGITREILDVMLSVGINLTSLHDGPIKNCLDDILAEVDRRMESPC
jgi:dCMP deaminase